MILSKKATIRTAVVVALLIITAVLCRFLARLECCKDWYVIGFIRSGIYIGLFTAWGISIRKRIIQKQIQRYLIGISALMVFWIFVRTIKFNLRPYFYLPTLHRFMWYFYYVGMLFIPLLALLVAFSLGKPEEYRLPKRTGFLFVITAVLLLLVLSNDLHQCVFTFPDGPVVWWDDDYGYGWAYYMVLTWEILCAVTALGIIISKCRVPRTRNFL